MALNGPKWPLFDIIRQYSTLKKVFYKLVLKLEKMLEKIFGQTFRTLHPKAFTR